MTTLITTKLDAASIGSMAQILAAAGLPTSDLTEPGRSFYRFDATTVVGYGGLEGSGTDCLLRSLLVLHDLRGLGIGKLMVAALEDEARAQGALRLHLLTNTAASFFRTCGYVDADRVNAPASIAASAEFTTLCPASAAYLVKPLEAFP